MAREDPDRIIRNVGRRLAELRRSKGWTQEEVAESLEIASRNYQELERGVQNLTLRTMVRLAHLFDVSVVELLKEPRDREVRVGRPRKSAGVPKPKKRRSKSR